MVFGISLTFTTKYENYCFTISLLSKVKMILKKILSKIDINKLKCSFGLILKIKKYCDFTFYQKFAEKLRNYLEIST